MSDIPFLTRIQQVDFLVADGSTGMTLISRGLPVGQTSEAWVMDAPENIVQLHKDFLKAGADILLTSTFNASSIRLKNSPLEGKTDLVVRKAVDLAMTAANGTQAYIAGSLGPVGGLIKPYGPLEADEVRNAYLEQAKAHTDAGADLLVIETQFDLAEIKAAIQGVRQVSDLPLVVSLSYDRGLRTMMGVNPSQAMEALKELPFDVIGVNCGHSLEENLQNLVALKPLTNKPVWFKPNAGLPHLDGAGRTVYDITPQAMGELAPSWRQAGANIIGGCCGTTPEHLKEIVRQVRL